MSNDELATKKDLAEGLAALEDWLLKELAARIEQAKTDASLNQAMAVLAQNTKLLEEIKQTLVRHGEKLDWILDAIRTHAWHFWEYRFSQLDSERRAAQLKREQKDFEQRIQKIMDIAHGR